MMKQACCIIVSCCCIHSNLLVFDHLNSALKMYGDMPVLASRSGTKGKACSVLKHLAIMFAQSHSEFSIHNSVLSFGTLQKTDTIENISASKSSCDGI